jgi:acetyl esterase/lipase
VPRSPDRRHNPYSYNIGMIQTCFIALWVLTGLFLSLWVIIPAPIFSLMPLSVGAPEISPGLILLNLLGLGLGVILCKSAHLSRWRRFSLGLSGFALILSSLPLTQFHATQQQAEQAMVQAFGPDYQTPVPAAIQTQWRSRPLSPIDLLRGIPTPAVRETPDIAFAQPDGVPLKLNLYRPAKVGQYPAIVTIYGGAWQRGNPAQDAAFNRYIAAQGYVVWAIAYRHAPQAQFPTQLTDVQSALQFIQQHATEYETNLDRVALMGRSAGAQLASLLAYKYSPIPIRAIVNYYGPVNLTAGYRHVPTPDPIGSRSTLRTFLGGTPDEFPDRYQQASPINAIGPDRPDSLLIYGGKDHIIKAQYGQALATALIAQNNRAALITIPWADHAFDAVFSGISNQLALYYTERFLAYELYGDR